MQTAFAVFGLITFGVAFFLVLGELETLAGPHAGYWLVAIVVILTLGGLSLWHSARGNGAAAFRRFCLMVAAGLTFQAWIHSPDVRAGRFRTVEWEAERVLAETRRSPYLQGTPVLKAEHEYLVARSRAAQERVLRELDASPYTRGRTWGLLALALLWAAAAVAGGRLYRLI